MLVITELLLLSPGTPGVPSLYPPPYPGGTYVRLPSMLFQRSIAACVSAVRRALPQKHLDASSRPGGSGWGSFGGGCVEISYGSAAAANNFENFGHFGRFWYFSKRWLALLVVTVRETPDWSGSLLDYE